MAETDQPRSVICDAGPLIHLDELGCIDLLRDFADVQVPSAVWAEVQRHRPTALRRRSVKLTQVSALPPALPALEDMAQVFLLDAGELEALRLMQLNEDAVFLTDDAAARIAASQVGYEVHGTIGVLLRALRRNQRSKRQVINLLKALPRRSTLFIETGLLNSIIEEVERA